MEAELVQLAKEKEFKSILLNAASMKCSDKEDTRYYLWMSELQKWLRDVYSININILIGDFENYFFEIFICKYNSNRTIRSPKWYRFKTYELALEQGLIEVLKLIKNE